MSPPPARALTREESRRAEAEPRHRHDRSPACRTGHRGQRAGLRRRHLVEHAATLGIDMEITGCTPGTRGVTPIPKRWTVEGICGWLMLQRRLARDYETLLARPEAMIHLAMTELMARRLTGENTIFQRFPARSRRASGPEAEEASHHAH